MRAHAPPRAPAVGIAGGLVPVAAVVVLDPAGWYPFGPAKQGAVFVAALVAVAWAVGRPGRLPRAVAWLWVGLLAWLGVAALVGADRLYAWIGTPERRLGWLAWALFAGCTWAGARIGGDRSAVRWLARMAVVAGAWCGAYCLVELLWRAPVETSAVTSRLGGPFGSAAYLGAALCLLVPVAAGVLADAGERIAWRAAAGFALATGLAALIGSGTRAAWVGVSVAAIGTAVARSAGRRIVSPGVSGGGRRIVSPGVSGGGRRIVSPGVSGRRSRIVSPGLVGRGRRIVSVGVGVGLAVGVVIAVLAVPRLGDVTERAHGGSSRLAEWEVAGRVIGAHPVLGAGPEGYRIVFAEGVDAGYEAEYGRDVLPDRAHSGPLDVATIGGVPAALLYAVLLALVARRALGAMRSGDTVWAGLGAGVVAYLAQQLFLFPLAEIDPTFWLIAGIVVSEAGGRAPDARSWRWVPLAVAGGVFAVSVLGVAADRSARTALRRSPGSPAALAAAERAAGLRPDVVRYQLLVSAVQADRQSVEGARRSVVAVERASDVSPGDPIVRRRLAEVRTRLAGVTGAPGDLGRALADWERLVADDPHCAACREGLRATRLLSRDR